MATAECSMETERPLNLEMFFGLSTLQQPAIRQSPTLTQNPDSLTITCVYFDNQGEWEGNALDLVLAAMQSFPNAAFLGLTFLPPTLPHYYNFPSDIGSNIGSFSVAVAGMHPTRQVSHMHCIFLLNILTN